MNKIQYRGRTYILESSIGDSDAVWDNYLTHEVRVQRYLNEDDDFIGRVIPSDLSVKVLIRDRDTFAFVKDGKILGEHEYPEVATWSEAVQRMKSILPSLLDTAKKLNDIGSKLDSQLKASAENIIANLK